MRSIPLALLALAMPGLAGEMTVAFPRGCRQLVLVTNANWPSAHAELQRYQRKKSAAPWAKAGARMDALIGENGLAWGSGLHTVPDAAAGRKREGDRCSPAGVFRLSSAFGTINGRELGPVRLPYRAINGSLEAVDDPASRSYNLIVDRREIAQPDWNSAEKMSAIPEYELGAVIDHNPDRVRGAGSCIFLHLWLAARRGTAGCTALRRPDLIALLRWLDAKEEPVIVQLPRAEAQRIGFAF